MRKNNIKDMTVTEQIEVIKDNVCDNICRWREHCLSIKKDPDDAQEYLEENYCQNCPLGRL